MNPKFLSFSAPLALALACFASAPPVSAAPLQAYPAYNALISPLTAFPVLSAGDRTCARVMGGVAISNPAIGPFQTPHSLGVVCGVTAAHLASESYLAAMFVVYLDAHRHTMGNYCPAPYDASGNYDASVLPGAFCGF